ncbi:hypothetical protein I79_003842 [Cricetulus griseus]|uniref:Uncharacterized protein n=1 Tax=Cricetulus griseus TaxID=10029 RepID=G3H120_CRIGR|nr:hypothetical protein I79_003842 [Cricetulus griseus]
MTLKHRPLPEFLTFYSWYGHLTNWPMVKSIAKSAPDPPKPLPHQPRTPSTPLKRKHTGSLSTAG